MVKYCIEGNVSLKGKIRASGNKNAALPCISAALLTDEPVRLRNVPDIEDVNVMLSILSSVGVQVRRIEKNILELHTQDIKSYEISPELTKKIRASVLVAGPLLARVGKVVLPPPGGDVIGRRRLDTHFLALTDLGAKVEIDQVFRLSTDRLQGREVFLDEASVTATENAIMAAVLAEGNTLIENAASEPHVQDLCNMLNSMGAKIQGVGSNILRIEGVKKLNGTDFALGSDYMEIGSFIGLAAVTRSELEIHNTEPQHLKMMRIVFAKLGIEWKQEGSILYMPADQKLKVVPDLGGIIPKVDDAPWPGFPADLTSIALVVATQVEGTVLVHEKMFESRMFFVDKLIDMGAKVVLCDPHRAVVSGPAKLRGSVMTSPDVRAGMAMVIAALCAEGESIIHNVYQIERGYENLTERLSALGAKIRRVQ
ncbi:MAG: UDP-N-acetylglucosamine 1-carboxyvinyltransferase [Spirochaetales bacterium]